MANSNVPVVKSQGRGRSNSLPTHVVEYLKAWLMDHMHHPYPTDQEKAEMMLKTGIDVKRLNNWFVNNRIRYWKPRMEALQRQQHQRKQTAIATLPLPGPYTRLVSSLVTDICPAPLSMQVESTTPQTVSKPLVLSDHKSTHVTTTTTKTAVPSTSSPSIVSDTSVYDEGDWSDGGSVRSKEDIRSKILPSPAAPLQNTVTPSPKHSRKRVLPEEAQLVTNDSILPSKTKFRRNDEVQWRDACLSIRRVSNESSTVTFTSTSKDDDDVTLPTLDEAALLFGFATSH